MPDKPDSNKGSILIVDDRPENLRLLNSMLGKKGYKTRPATSGKIAIQSALLKKPDLILLDVIMPEMDGFEVCRILKKNQETASIPVIFISALDDSENKLKGFNVGGVDYICKPFYETEVLARVETHITLYRMKENLEKEVEQRTNELKKAYKELSLSEEKYRRLFNDALDLIHIVDKNGKIIDANQVELQTLGYSRDEYFGKPIKEIIHPDYLAITLKNFQKVIAGKKIKNYETVLITKGGESLNVEVSAVPLIQDGEIVSARAIIRDITERKKAEEELKRNHALYMQSQKIARLGHWEMDHVKDKLIWSDEIYNILEVEKKIFQPNYEALREYFHTDDRDSAESTFQRTLRERTKFDFIHRIVTPNGKVKHVHVQGRHTFDDKTGQPLTSLGTWQDITELKLVEEKLKESQEQWELTFQAIGDATTIQDLNHRIVRVNQKTCELLSATPQELEGRLCYEVFQGKSEPCPNCPIVKDKGEWKTHSEKITNVKLNKIFIVSASPILDSQKQIKGVIHFAKDITEKEKLEGQLRQAQKMEAIGTLAGGIAHDFNNILTPILGYAEIALDKIPSESPLFSHLQHIVNASNRAKELVKQILTFSRNTEQQLSPLKIQFIIKEAIKLLRASIPSTIEIKQNIDPDCGEVMADPTQIHQVIMNLCTNAYHAMRDKGGTMEVRLEQSRVDSKDTLHPIDLPENDYVRLTVKDTGKGIEKDMLDRIFDPYFTTKKQGEGTGLGLSVVHGIITALKGKIYVTSELQKGSSFSVYLPVIKRIVSKSDGRDEVDEFITSRHEHILVVDDEKPVVDIISIILRQLGYQVTPFTECEKALNAFVSSPDKFDLIITDMTMPHITGAMLAGEVLKIRSDIPIILCTGYSELIDKEKAKVIGIKELIIKPVRKTELAKAVKRAFDTKTE